MRKKCIYFILLCIVPCTHQVYASYNKPDSSDMIVNGWEYSLKPAGRGHPFLEGNVWSYGKISSLLGERDNYLINYDIFQQVLIIQYINQGLPRRIILNPMYIKSFEIGGRKFINPVNSPVFSRSEFQGYFEIIHTGEFYYLSRPGKKIIEGTSLGETSYEDHRDDFIFYKEKLLAVKNKRSLYRIFPELKKEIARYIRKNQIIFSNAGRDEIRRVMLYIENEL